MNLLEFRNIHAAYDRIDVLFGIDLAVPAGSVVALLGPNGAGKTTTLRVAAGLHPVLSGDLLVAGRRVNGTPPEELARLRFARCSDAQPAALRSPETRSSLRSEQLKWARRRSAPTSVAPSRLAPVKSA